MAFLCPKPRPEPLTATIAPSADIEGEAGAEHAATPPAKRVHIKTFGCQMNVYDSQRMADALAPLGYGATETPEDADLVILNTCHIRERASEKLYSHLGRLRELRETRAEAGGGRLTIAVAGCVAQAEGAEVLARQPAVDFVVGPQAYHELPQMIARAARAAVDRVAADLHPHAKFDALPKARAVTGPTAFLTVQEGCDKFCAFCVVPYTRGAEYSRPVASVLEEAERLADQGVRELTLLGQNVNAYDGRDADGTPSSLARLARRLAAIAGLDRIRYTTSHPGDMSEDLIAAHGELPALMPYLHLPVQSGSDRLLKAMNRGHTADAYLALVQRIRAARPDIALTSDFIVGFPGETDEDFAATLQLARAVRYAAAFTFKYSRRPGTPAADMAAQVPEPIKAERLARLQAAVEDDRQAFNRATVGRTLPILFERAGRRPGQIVGRSPYLQGVWTEGPASLIGTIAEVRIEACGPNSLTGRLSRPAIHRGPIRPQIPEPV